jgi:hypothetical protein
MILLHFKMFKCISVKLTGIILILAILIPEADAYYTTRGQEIIERETGKKVLLKGFGIGCWLLPEGYMWGIRKLNRPRQFEESINDLIGRENAKEFWRLYHSNFLTEGDIKAIKLFGANSIRVALLASLLQPCENQPKEPPYSYSEYGFSLLDSVVKWCEKYHLGLIWDMHGAPGAQNRENISDSDGEARLWTEKEIYWPRCKDLWFKIAERYKDSPCIIGYDLLNEPLLRRYEGISVDLLRELYIKLTDTIRTVDTSGIIFVEGDDWAQNFSMLEPIDWDPHLVLAFHSYPPTYNQEGLNKWDELRDKYNIPLWHGETGEVRLPYELNRKATEFLGNADVGWSWWTHKKFEIATQPWVCIRTPGFEKILNYWKGDGIKPQREEAKKWLFDQAIKTNSKYCDFLPEMVSSLSYLKPDSYIRSKEIIAPDIFQEPENLNLETGEVGILRVRATGFPLNYQWKKNGKALPGANLSTLHIDNLTLEDDSSYYSVVVYNGEGKVSSKKALLRVTPYSRLVVKKSKNIPVIDGKVDEIWLNTEEVPIKKNVVGVKPESWDLSGYFKLQWDNNYLYILIDVTDEKQISESYREYFKDGIELYLDLKNDKKEMYGEDDFMVRYNWKHDISIERGISISNIIYSQSDKNNGYIMEIAFPYSASNISLKSGDFIGIDVHINDNDSNARETKLAWSDDSDKAHRNPSVFGFVKLQE